MSGYKSPPYSILSFWSMKSALQLTPGERSVDAFNDVLEYAAEIEFDMAKGRKESPLVQIVTESDLVHMRMGCGMCLHSRVGWCT